MIILGVFLPIIRGWTVMLHLCRLWVAIAMVAKMIYQLTLIDKEYWNSNCTVSPSLLFISHKTAEFIVLHSWSEKILFRLL